MWFKKKKKYKIVTKEINVHVQARDITLILFDNNKIQYQQNAIIKHELVDRVNLYTGEIDITSSDYTTKIIQEFEYIGLNRIQYEIPTEDGSQRYISGNHVKEIIISKPYVLITDFGTAVPCTEFINVLEKI